MENKTRPDFTLKSGFSKQERGFGHIQSERGRKGHAITQEELDVKKEEFFARGGTVERLDQNGNYLHEVLSNTEAYIMREDGTLDSIISDVRSQVNSDFRVIPRSLYNAVAVGYGD
jgi:hypothetical protein